MKNNIGIWLDTSQAFVINKLGDIKTIASEIEFREREAGESKKFGRFGNQYMTYEKNRENKRINLTNLYFKKIVAEIEECESVILFGPSLIKNQLGKEIVNNKRLEPKLKGIFNAELLTQNQLVAWVKDYYKPKAY
ncbi:hypothetical protein [Lutibacter sp.]|uniref:hypothetical protein n=1 Tax=Lutibacter sp. TaxID=1925666 RepID=UPI002737069B|nr:hypothetical protein [Lutibacter sp.]MDP3314240.1 hypothetical protein [Lutibacter sp.]